MSHCLGPDGTGLQLCMDLRMVLTPVRAAGQQSRPLTKIAHLRAPPAGDLLEAHSPGLPAVHMGQGAAGPPHRVHKKLPVTQDLGNCHLLNTNNHHNGVWHKWGPGNGEAAVKPNLPDRPSHTLICFKVTTVTESDMQQEESWSVPLGSKETKEGKQHRSAPEATQSRRTAFRLGFPAPNMPGQGPANSLPTARKE